MNTDMEDVGVLQSFELDMAYGENENNFELNLSSNQHCCEAGYFIYVDGTEYGGIVDEIKSDNGNDEITYSGRTWHGILGSKVVVPLLSGEGSSMGVTVKQTDNQGNSLVDRYLIISGYVNDCIKFMLTRCGMNSLFVVSDEPVSAYINEYQFYRYTDLYSGLVRMLASQNLKMKISFFEGKCRISCASKTENNGKDEFSSDNIDFVISKKYKTVNHLLCLGSGELEERLVLHLYADANGNISESQTLFGLNEHTKTYEYPSESLEELAKAGTEELKRLLESVSLNVDCDESTDIFDVGDTITASDIVTGIDVQSTIIKKIVSIKDGLTEIQYKVGDK